MIEEQEAVARILGVVSEGRIKKRKLVEAVGAFAAKDYRATVPLPGFDNSAMDGYAVRASDCGSIGAELLVAGEQPAGVDLGLRVGAGEAVRIFTGAPMPSGADAVVMQEDSERCELGGKPGVRILEAVERVGEFVRKKGSDVCVGQKVLGRGEAVAVQTVGLLASQGLGEVEVRTPPRVGILSTGDELVAPGEALEAGQIYNSNGGMLEALARAAGAESVGLWRVKDDATALGIVLEEMLAECDFVLISGGVSVGEHDHVKAVLEKIGVESDFWRVRVKPGKPFLFGRRESGGGRAKLVFGLPGNPVSSFVTFLLFVHPAIRKWMGAGERWLDLPWSNGEAGEEIENRGDRPHYVRGALDVEGRFFPTGLQQSHALGGLAQAEGMVRLGAGEIIELGGTVRVLRWG